MGGSGRWRAPLLVGRHVTLRQLTADDADAVWEMINDAETTDLTASTELFSRDQIDTWCRTRPQQDNRLDLAIIETSTGQFAGEAVLNDFDAAAATCNFRIALRGPAWFGRGLGTEATRLIIGHGLTTMGLASISLDVLARNPRARALYHKVGFHDERAYQQGGEQWIAMRIAAGRHVPTA